MITPNASPALFVHMKVHSRWAETSCLEFLAQSTLGQVFVAVVHVLPPRRPFTICVDDSARRSGARWRVTTWSTLGLTA